MVGLYAGEGVAVVGNRHADAIHQHLGDLIAIVRGDGEGLACALLHRYVAGGINAAACARLCGDGVGLRLRIRLPAGCPEGNGNGVVLLHAGKGVPVAGKLVQHAGIVHNHLGDLIAFVRGDGEGLACALLHRYVAGGINAAACARLCGDGVGLGLRFRLPAGLLEGDRNTVVLLHVGKGVAVVGDRHADTVHQHVGDLIAIAGGDGEGLVLTLVHCYAAGGSNAAACARLCGDGVGLRFQFRAGGGAVGDGAGVVRIRFLHADIAGVLGVGLAVGLGVVASPSRAVKAVLRTRHRRDGGRQGLTVAVPGKGEGKCIRRFLIRLGRIDLCACGVGGLQGGGRLVADGYRHSLAVGVGSGVGATPSALTKFVLRALHRGDGDGTVALIAGDGVVQRRLIGIGQLAEGHLAGVSLRAGVVVFVRFQPGGEGVAAFRRDAVKAVAGLPAAVVHPVLRAVDGIHGVDELVGVRAADGVAAGDTSGGSLVGFFNDAGSGGGGGGQGVVVRGGATQGDAAGGDCPLARVGAVIGIGGGRGGDVVGVAVHNAAQCDRQGGGDSGGAVVGLGCVAVDGGRHRGLVDGVGGRLICLAGVAALAGDGDGDGSRIGGVTAELHVVVVCGQFLVAQHHGDSGLLLGAGVGKAILAQGHGGAGDVRWLRRGIRVIAVSIFVNAVDGAVGAVQHGVVVIRLVVIQVLVPGKGFTLRRGCSPAVEQPGHLAGGEVIGGFDHGVCRVGGKLALALVGAAGQVIAVADRGLGALVLAHDGAHIVGAIRRNGAGVVAVADVDPAVVAVAQDAAHAAGAAHTNRNAVLVGAVLNGAGADVAHDTGHAARGHRNGDFAGVDAVFHRGAAVLGHGAHHAADVVVAGADGDVHPADHAADGAARRSGAQGADRAAHFRNGFIAGDGDAAGDGEVFDGAGDIAEQAGIAFGVFDGHTADGIALAVKGAGVGGALAADRGPGLAAQLDVRSQHRAGARILLRAVGQGAVDQPGEPEQLERIGQLIAALRIRLGQRRAAGTFAILTEAVLRGEGFFDGLAALFRGGDGVGTAVQRDFAFRKGKRPAIGGEGVAEHRGAGQDDLLLVVGTGHVIGYLDARYSDGGKAAVALQAAAAGQAGFGGDG